MKSVNRMHKGTMPRALLAAMVATLSGLSSTSHGATPTSLAQAPLFLVTAAEPLVMLNLSNDHQLFYKAYDDWSDVDGDGEVDITYKHSIDYYGYFDSYKCYEYESSPGRFEPEYVTADKYCNGGEWSGNFLNWASMARIDTVRKILYGGHRSTDTATTTVLERTYLPGDAHSFAKYYETTTTEMARLTPFAVDEITLCSTTYASDGVSETRTDPPLIRVADGNFALWAANERYQCHWKDKGELEDDIFDSPNPNTNNGNHEPTTGLDASADNPSWTTQRLGSGDYIVRVQACVSGLIGQENCQVYPGGNPKPVGLLQQYGEEGQIRFGLMTGSFQKNKSGGTLRRNVGDISNEINVDTDGTFKSPPPTGGNIIRSLSALRVSGYDHNPGYYNVDDNCSWGLNSFTDGNCTNWGNPQSEIFLESLRYFAGETPNSAFAANDSGYISNLPTAGTWSDPLSNDNYCAPLNIIQFNASVISYDGDQLGGASDLTGLGSPSAWVDKVGAGEGINGTDRFVGEGTGTTTTDGLCTAKTLTNMSDAEGLCPEAPRLEGTYNIAGLAYYAHTNTIRTDLDETDGSTADIRVDTYGVSLAPSVPKIEVPVTVGGVQRTVTILPACRNQSISGNCAIVDFKVVQPHEVSGGIGTGKFYVNWEDSEQGGDYDQDMAGVLSYSVDGDEITVTTSTFADSTPNLMAFGYVIAGTTKDGFHAHSGINGFTAYTDPTGVLSCNGIVGGCTTGAAATSVTYDVGTSSAALLEDPLWYASKWGGFKEQDDPDDRPDGTADPNDVPDQAYEWDSNGDGQPDSYFFATNPAQLATSLSKVFLGISEQQASAASTAANSQRADAGTFVFQARFNSKEWSSELLKFTVNLTTGQLQLDTSTWGALGDAGALLNGQSSRRIITYDAVAGEGIPFRWTNLQTAGLGTLLSIDPETATADANGEARLDFIRGDRSNELQNGGSFRNRVRVLGDIVSSSPVYVGTPAFNYPDYLEASGETYTEFKTRVGSRSKLLYVGANDGMLHAFDVDTGAERLAFIPNAVLPNLPQLTSLNYTHRYFVDGSPSIGDVFYDSNWHTVLVGGLNAGGQAVYALDVTTPDTSFTEGNAANLVLWEINPSTSGFADLGYTFSRPAIVKNNDGDWVAVFGNGYASASGKAVLYVVDIKTGALVSSVVVDDSGDNGLSTVAPVDTNGDQIIDAMYAGDLKGNLWKFIPSSTNSSTWKAAWGSTPLFTAPADASGFAQPITSRPEVGIHPERKQGVMVYFGTGKYFENGDNVASTNVQRFYGIWDLWDEGARSSINPADNPPNSPSISASNLLQQCVTTGTYADTCVANAAATTGETLEDYDVRFVSDHEIGNWHWNSSTGRMGWYLDLPELGEMQVTNSVLRGGRIIFVTVIPSDHSCSDGGESWLMELDAADGSRMPIAVFDINGDGLFNLDDTKPVTDDEGNEVHMAPAGKKSKEGIIQPPTILTGPDGRREFKYASGSTGTVELTVENPVPFDEGRKSWLQLK